MARPTPKASTVAHAVEGLVHSIAGLVDSLATSVRDVKAVGKAAKGVKAAVKGLGNRKPRSAASRAAQAAKMRAYWRKRKAAKGGAK